MAASPPFGSRRPRSGGLQAPSPPAGSKQRPLRRFRRLAAQRMPCRTHLGPGTRLRPSLRVGEHVNLVWRLAAAGQRMRYDSDVVAGFIRRFPARESRRRFCSPDDASSGAVPLPRRISDAMYSQLLGCPRVADENLGAGPVGHCGASQESSAVDSHPHIDTSDQPLPGPANQTLRPRSPGCAGAGAIRVGKPRLAPCGVPIKCLNYPKQPAC